MQPSTAAERKLDESTSGMSVVEYRRLRAVDYLLKNTRKLYYVGVVKGVKIGGSNWLQRCLVNKFGALSIFLGTNI
jgi:hypothetical protein